MLDIPSAEILLASDVDFVNKGAASEMFAGLEMVKYYDCFQKPEIHYWQNRLLRDKFQFLTLIQN